MAERPKIPSSCPEDGAGWVGLSAGWNFSTYIAQFCLLKLSGLALISLCSSSMMALSSLCAPLMFAVSLPRTLNSCATVKKSRCNWWAFHYFCKNKKRNRRVGSVISSTLSHFELFLQEQRMLVTNGGTETLPNSKQPLSKVQTKHNTRRVHKYLN